MYGQASQESLRAGWRGYRQESAYLRIEMLTPSPAMQLSTPPMGVLPSRPPPATLWHPQRRKGGNRPVPAIAYLHFHYIYLQGGAAAAAAAGGSTASCAGGPPSHSALRQRSLLVHSVGHIHPSCSAAGACTGGVNVQAGSRAYESYVAQSAGMMAHEGCEAGRRQHTFIS